MAPHHEGVRRVLRDVWWNDLPCVRLGLFLNEAEGASPDGDATTRLLHSMSSFMPDEKCAEDLHQTCRDESRRERQKCVGLNRLQRTCIESDLPTRRNMRQVEIPIDEIAEEIGKPPTRVRQHFEPSPQHWPVELNDITRPSRSWASPVQSGYYKGLAAWLWLVFWHANFRHAAADEKVAITASFRCKLASTCKLLVRGADAFFIISVLPWALVVWDCQWVEDEVLRLRLRGNACIRWIHLAEVNNWEVCTVSLVFKAGHGLVMRIDSRQGLLQHCLLNRTVLVADELQISHA